MGTTELLSAFLWSQNDRHRTEGFEIQENSTHINSGVLKIEVLSFRTNDLMVFTYSLLDYITFVFNYNTNQGIA